MAEWRIALGLFFALASSALFIYAGRFHSKRSVSPQATTAQAAFVAWWYGLGAITLGGSIFTVLANVGIDDLALWEVWTFFSLGILCVALWGLVYYLAYLFTGRRAWAPALAVGYVVYFFLLLYFIQLSHPIAVEVSAWRASIEYEFEVRGALYNLVIALLLLPQIIGALAYFTLVFRVRDRAQRYRISLVSWAIIIWFASPLLALDPNVANTDAWQIASRLIGLAAAFATLLAYRPPMAIQRWLERGKSGRPASAPAPPKARALGVLRASATLRSAARPLDPARA